MLLLRMGQRLHIAKRIEFRPHSLLTDLPWPSQPFLPCFTFVPNIHSPSNQTYVFTKYDVGLFIIGFAEFPASFPFSLSFKNSGMYLNNSIQWKDDCWYCKDSDSGSVLLLTSCITFGKTLISPCFHFPIIKKVGTNSCCDPIIS